MRADSYTPAETAWLVENYPEHHNAELSEMHAEAFPDRPRRTPKAISSRAKLLRLHKAEGFVRNQPRLWTPDRVEWFRAFVPGHTESEISAEHERLYGSPLSEGQIGNAKARFGVKSGTHGGRFEKGRAGGFQSDDHRRRFLEAGKRTRFEKGNVPHNAVGKGVGYERVSKDGYVEVKVKDGLQGEANDNFRMKHHVVYEQHNGEIPDGCNIVFADHDKRNFDPENLVAVPRGLWAIIRKMGAPYHDRESLEACMNLARLKRATNSAKCRPRPCKRCGVEFAPRYERQRTCDRCLGREA